MTLDAQAWIAIGAVITAIGTVIGVVYKLTPERSNIIVTSAETSLRMANESRDDCQEQLAKETAARIKAEARVAGLQREVADKTEEIAVLRRMDRGKS